MPINIYQGEGSVEVKKNAGRSPEVSWKMLERNVPVFNPITNKCRLCLREKFYIVFYTLGLGVNPSYHGGEGLGGSR